MFHIWWLQIQRKESLGLTVFCVRNFLMSLKVPYSKAEVSKGSEKRVESCNMLFLRACRDVRRWLLTRADLVAGTAQKTTSCPNLYSSQTNLLTRQRQPGEMCSGLGARQHIPHIPFPFFCLSFTCVFPVLLYQPQHTPHGGQLCHLSTSSFWKSFLYPHKVAGTPLSNVSVTHIDLWWILKKSHS